MVITFAKCSWEVLYIDDVPLLVEIVSSSSVSNNYISIVRIVVSLNFNNLTSRVGDVTSLIFEVLEPSGVSCGH
jgi:hypothetical protein